MYLSSDSQRCLWINCSSLKLYSTYGETKAQKGEGVRSRSQTPVPSLGPHSLPTSSSPSSGPGTVFLRFPSQESELQARHWGLQCPLPDPPEFPYKATEVGQTSYNHGFPHSTHAKWDQVFSSVEGLGLSASLI